MTLPMLANSDVSPMRILAIDPGQHESGWVDYCGGRVIECGCEPNDHVLAKIGARKMMWSPAGIELAIELFEPRGMGVGNDSIETIIWTGRMIQAWHDPDSVVRVKRSAVKSHLCGSQKANDTAIRAALLDLFGGKQVAIGRKKTPGPLYAVKGHAWSALAVAVTAEAMLSGSRASGVRLT